MVLRLTMGIQRLASITNQSFNVKFSNIAIYIYIESSKLNNLTEKGIIWQH